MKYRAQLEERNASGPIVIKKSKRKEFVTRQGRARWMLEPGYYSETPLQMWRVFIHEIRTKSGKHRHQGGIIIYVLEGKGYSIVAGERKDWEKGDLVLLPLRPEGIEHQHFNLGGPEKPAVWVAFINVPIIEHLASELKQVENSPEFTQ
jgi:quercetin dioxygenase-like cupin family protein